MRALRPRRPNAAASRACLEAQIEAQDRADAATADAMRQVEAERAEGGSLRRELEQAQVAVETEREAAVRLRREIADVRKSVEAERAAAVARDRELERVGAALLAEQEAAAARGRDAKCRARARSGARENCALAKRRWRSIAMRGTSCRRRWRRSSAT